VDLCHVIQFTRTVAPYMAGEQAGFPAAQADHYIKHGYATLVRADVPIVAPEVQANDARRRIDELRALLGAAETEHAAAAAAAKRTRAAS
jgi:hypothetical protein